MQEEKCSLEKGVRAIVYSHNFKKMIPVYEQGISDGIGYSFDTFLKRFKEICKTHIESKRAHAFAFIFFDFTSTSIKAVLNSLGGFAKLDRLSSNNLSVFYLHSDSKRLIDNFNETLRYVFNIDKTVALPFVLFIKFDGEINNIEEFKITQLEQNNPLFALDELYETIEVYIKSIENKPFDKSYTKNKMLQSFKSFKKIAAEQFIKVILENGYKRVMNI